MKTVGLIKKKKYLFPPYLNSFLEDLLGIKVQSSDLPD